MGLFGKKKEVVEPTGFQQFVANDRKYWWVADYITSRNEIDEDFAFEGINMNDSHLGVYTMPKFKKLVAKLYSQYLDIDEEVSNEDLWLLAQIERMPVNITIRRIKAKASGNNWSAQYLGRTVYYGKTLHEALKKLQDRNPKIAAKFAGPEA